MKRTLLLTCLTVVQYHALEVIHARIFDGPWKNIIPTLALNIANGSDEWMHVAQRVLLPKTLLLISTATGVQFFTIWYWAVFLMLFATNLVTYLLLRANETTKQIAAAFTVLQAAAFVCWQEPFILGPYDLVDNIVWFLFAYGAWTNKTWKWFAVLFVIELHNREVAIFFPLWVALQNLFPLENNK